MQQLIMLKGLPGSGKTTYAKELLAKNPKMIRVNKDDIRKMIRYTKDMESLVLAVSRSTVNQALNKGFSVVVDDTNFNPIHEKELEWMATKLGIAFKIVTMHTSLEECIRRDSLRNEDQRVGEKVIRDMHTKYCSVKQ